MSKSSAKAITAAAPKAVIPRVGEGRRGEAGYLGYLLRQAAHAQRRRMDRALATVGLTHPQFLVMTMIRAYPGCSNADIARLTLLTPQTVHAIVAALRCKMLVSRQPHPVHGRILSIALTNAGKALLARGRARALAVESALKDMMTDREEAAVRRWLVDIARAAPAE